MVRLHGQKFWLHGVVDPQMNELLHVSLYPITNKQTTRWFLTELHRRYQLNNAEFPVNFTYYLGLALAEDDYQFQVIRCGNRNVIKMYFEK
jgi:transposase-like protein